MAKMFNFKEGLPYLFAPTFKLKPLLNKYNLKRVPSWCDRIIYRSRENYLRLLNYDSNNLLTQSDHRPVFAQFTLNMSLTSQQSSFFKYK